MDRQTNIDHLFLLFSFLSLSWGVGPAFFLFSVFYFLRVSFFSLWDWCWGFFYYFRSASASAFIVLCCVAVF